MSKAIETKKVVVQTIADKFDAAQSVVVVDYRGLNVAQLTELRKQLREEGIEFKVYKNSMTRRATKFTALKRSTNTSQDRTLSHSRTKTSLLLRESSTTSQKRTKH